MDKKKTETVLRLLFILPALFYVLAVVKMTFFKDGVRVATTMMYRVVPFNGLYEYKAGVKSLTSVALNYLGNIAMFIPLGIFLPVFFKKLKLWSTVIVGIFFSIAVEALQYALASGYADIDDLIMNTIGAAVGGGIYFYILNGRKKTEISYIITLFFILVTEFVSLYGVWYYAPNLLPDKMAVIDESVAGRSLYDYDVRFQCYKMSHGDLFIVKGTVQDRSGNKLDKDKTYRLSDTAIFITESKINGKMEYHVLGLEDMIKEVSAREEAYVKIWLSNTMRCSIVMLEKY